MYKRQLDTTALIPWLKETFNYDVVCCCINCGQGNELDGLDERAKLSGASKLYIEDIVDEFCDEYIMPCVEAGAVYEHQYLLGTSMARPAIAKKLVEIARKENAVAICHGATGKGNDQIRFELGIKALAVSYTHLDVYKRQISVLPFLFLLDFLFSLLPSDPFPSHCDTAIHNRPFL